MLFYLLMIFTYTPNICIKCMNICDRLWENQTIGAEFSIELQLNLCLQYKISNKMLLMYKYLQSRFSRYYILRLQVSNAHNSGMKLGMWTLSISLCRQCSALSLGTLITKILVCSNSLVFLEPVTYSSKFVEVVSPRECYTYLRNYQEMQWTNMHERNGNNGCGIYVGH